MKKEIIDIISASEKAVIEFEEALAERLLIYVSLYVENREIIKERRLI